MAKSALIGIRAIVIHKLSGTTYLPGFRNFGARALTREVEQEIIKFFADNTEYDSQEGLETITGELTSYHFEKQMWVDHFGFIEEDNGGFSDGNQKSFGAITFIMDYKDVETQRMGYRVGIMYKNKFRAPSIDISTTEDAVEYTELVSGYDGSISHVKGKHGKEISYFWYDSAPGVTLDELIEFSLPKPTLPSDTLPVSSDDVPPVFTASGTTITSWTTADDGTKLYSDIITELSVVVTDDVDGVITNQVTFWLDTTEVLPTDMVDLSGIGSQEVTLKASDSAGNESTGIATINVTA